jgi:hypothetical protein
MATHTLQPGASPANPAPRVPPAPNSLARRAMLGAIAATPLLALPASAAAPDMTEWQIAMREYRQSDAALNAAITAHGKVEERYFAENPERPKYVVETEEDYGRLGRLTLPMTVREEDLADPHAIFDTAERTAEMREGFAAYHREEAAVKERTGYAASEQRYEQVLDANIKALARLLAIPAPSFAALAEKIEVIIGEYDDSQGRVAGALADLRRLSGEALS